MGIPKISESNKQFLMDSIKALEIDKEIMEQSKAEGKIEGKIEGKTEGKAEILIKLLMKKFKKLPSSYKDEILKLPQETIELIAMEIFDLNAVEDLNQYL